VTPAQEWSKALTRGMERRGVTQTALAAQVHISEDIIRKWRQGRILAGYEYGLSVATALDLPSLGELLRRLRTRNCTDCGRSFIVKQMPDARFCPRQTCRQHQYDQKRRKIRTVSARNYRRRVARRLTIYQDTIVKMCAQCESEGICHMADCPIQLRGLSPLPLAVTKAA